ncbi:hypothetical protein BGW80DRAFT_415650 [Lactifluus volemus]|nr:hypothetical protein BGW80DRAFT_415650 [Lactifluus volemus]
MVSIPATVWLARQHDTEGRQAEPALVLSANRCGNQRVALTVHETHVFSTSHLPPCVRWVSTIWDVLDRSVTVPDRSETQSPTSSMRTIQSIMSSSTNSSSMVSGSRSTTFVPPVDTIPDLSDFQSLSASSSASLSH